MKKLLSTILLTLPVAVMAGDFTCNPIRIAAEEWKAGKDGGYIAIHTSDDILMKPYTYRGTGAHRFDMGTAVSGLEHYWSIDFNMDGGDKIDLTFTHPSFEYPDYQYDYGYEDNVGFHFQDVDDTWRPIVGVTVSTPFAPRGFDPSLVQFDENNIYVNLKGSDCVGGSCLHHLSPTGLNNIITLNIQFQGNPDVYRIKEIDLLFNWLEGEHPEYFRFFNQPETFYDPWNGLPTRYYLDNGMMVVQNEHVTYYYRDSLDIFSQGKVSFGSMDTWLEYSGIERELCSKKDAARKAVKDEKARKEAEKARKEEEARQAKLRWEEANRGPYDPHHEESDSYSEPLDSYGEGLY